MNTNTVIVLAVVLFGWSIVSDRLAARNLTGPIVFVVAGLLLANSSWGIVTVDAASSTVHVLAELTLGRAPRPRLDVGPWAGPPPRPAADVAPVGHRPAAVDRRRRGAGHRSVPRPSDRPRRPDRGRVGSHRCRAQRLGDRRRPPADR